MPGEDGMALTRALRETHETPILLLTAKGETGSRIEGLEAGADDYLAKPFEPKELLLRINAILRRVPDTTATDAAPKVLSLGAIRYDMELERGEMWQGDDLVRLTATEMQLMKIFSAQPGTALSRATLVEELGRDRGQAQERAVDVQITPLSADGARCGLYVGGGLGTALLPSRCLWLASCSGLFGKNEGDGRRCARTLWSAPDRDGEYRWLRHRLKR